MTDVVNSYKFCDNETQPYKGRFTKSPDLSASYFPEGCLQNTTSGFFVLRIQQPGGSDFSATFDDESIGILKKQLEAALVVIQIAQARIKTAEWKRQTSI